MQAGAGQAAPRTHIELTSKTVSCPHRNCQTFTAQHAPKRQTKYNLNRGACVQITQQPPYFLAWRTTDIDYSNHVYIGPTHRMQCVHPDDIQTSEKIGSRLLCFHHCRTFLVADLTMQTVGSFSVLVLPGETPNALTNSKTCATVMVDFGRLAHAGMLVADRQSMRALNLQHHLLPSEIG